MLRAPTYFPALTGVRALAAYAVFLYHFNPFPEHSWTWQLAQSGGMGVTIFFVLSGFLICLRYIDRLDFSAHWLTAYARNRVARIYPMYLLMTLLTFCFIAVDPSFDPIKRWTSYVFSDKLLVIGLNLTFLRGFFNDFVFTGVAQGWTLTIEECFYFLAPLLLVTLHKRRHPAGLLLLYSVLFVGIGIALVAVLPHRFGFFESLRFLFTFTFFGRCVEFLMGIGLALLVRRMPPVTPRKRALGTYAGIGWMLAIIVLISKVVRPEDHLLGGPAHYELIVLADVLLPIGIVCFLWGLLYEQSPVRWVLETSLFDKLGKSSYSFYLIHMGIFSQLLERYVTDSISLRFGALVLLAYGFFVWVEQPAHRWLSGKRERQPVISEIAPA